MSKISLCDECDMVNDPITSKEINKALKLVELVKDRLEQGAKNIIQASKGDMKLAQELAFDFVMTFQSILEVLETQDSKNTEYDPWDKSSFSPSSKAEQHQKIIEKIEELSKTMTKFTGDDYQWAYFQSTKKLKEILSNNKDAQEVTEK